MYYQIGVLDGFTGEEIHQVVTKAPLFILPILDKVIELIEEQYGKDITIVWDEKDGEMPEGIDVIRPNYKTVDYHYNR